MKPVARLLLPGALALLFGCDASAPTTPPSAAVATSSDLVAGPRITVVTQNIYVGADVDAILAALLSADPSDDIPTLLQQIQVLQQTHFPTRAAAFAAEVARTRPHLIGLQEVSTIDIDLSAVGGPVYRVDFLPALIAAFRARGLPYAVVARQRNFEVTPAPGIRLVDEDVMFRDTRRVQLDGPALARTYSTNLGPVAPGVTLEYGYVVTPAVIEGRHLTVASTHLQDDLAPLDLTNLRAAQMQELLQVIGPARRAIIMGDLNDFAGSAMHQLALGGGFVDTWAELHPGTAGYTCCHESDLSNPSPLGYMDQRIDFVFARGFRREAGQLIGSIVRVGYEPRDKMPGPYYPLWAADHAGLAATLGIAE